MQSSVEARAHGGPWAQARRPSWPMVAAFAVALAAWWALADGGYAWRRFWMLGVWGSEVPSWPARLARQAFFASWYALAGTVLLTLPLMRRRVALPLLAALFACTTVDLAYVLVSGKSAGLADVAILNASLGSLDDALREYPAQVLGGLGLAAVVFVPAFAVALRPRAAPRHPRGALVAAAALSLALAHAAAAVVKGEQGLLGFPLGFSYALGTAVLAADDLHRQAAGAAPAQVAPLAQRPPVRKVVLVVDESVRWREFARAWRPHEAAVDFGAAVSGANCSATSNFILRKAALAQRGPVEVPSLFALARRAGFRTTYIDNQGVLKDPTVRNYFDASELAEVDQVIGRGRRVRHEVDLAALDTLEAILGRDGADFVLVNKLGAHFPYAQALPAGQRSGTRELDYEAAIALQSVAWLRRLANAAGRDAIVFYTSDHGQAFHGGATHCNTGEAASAQEWSVPILVLAREPTLHSRLRQAAAASTMPVSHFELTEAVRNTLGFRAPTAPASLLDPQAMRDRRAPACGYWGPPRPLFGRPPACRPITVSTPKP